VLGIYSTYSEDGWWTKDDITRRASRGLRNLDECFVELAAGRATNHRPA
jgi:hypothetical protein